MSVEPIAPAAHFTDMTRLLLLLTTTMVVLAVGCAPRRTAPAGATTPFTGPTEPMAAVVAEINANNAALPTIWARHYFEANVVDEQKKSHFVNGDGVLLYKGPRGMRLVGTKAAAGTIFEIGSSDDRYWMTLVPERNTMWWGWYKNLGKPCVDTRNIPIRPDLVLEVLGVATINTNFMQTPVPTMRFNNYAFGGEGAYMFVWNVPTPAGDRWVAQREIWYDRAQKLPRAVLLFDENGRIVLEAKLDRHAPVEIPDTPQDRWPVMAREYKLMFPDTGSTMTLELDEVALDRRGVPARRGITFPEDAKVDQVVQLDRDCTD